MTLILTLMRPGEGVWQTVDARVTARGKLVDDFAFKQVSVHRADGTLLLAYTGLAELHPSGESMFDWIRSTIRGENRNSEGDLLHLRERLNRDVARSRYARVPVIIVAVGVLGVRPDANTPLQDRRMVRWILTNLTWPNGPTRPARVVREFQLEGEWVDKPVGFSLGSGSNPVLRSPSDLALLRRGLEHRPNKPLDYLGLLAAVNRRVAPLAGGTVSPWCSGTYMPEIGQELQSRSFSERGDPESPHPIGIDAIVFGIDLTESTRHLRQQLTASLKGQPTPPEFDSSRMLAPRP